MKHIGTHVSILLVHLTNVLRATGVERCGWEIEVLCSSDSDVYHNIVGCVSKDIHVE